MPLRESNKLLEVKITTQINMTLIKTASYIHLIVSSKEQDKTELCEVRNAMVSCTPCNLHFNL